MREIQEKLKSKPYTSGRYFLLVVRSYPACDVSGACAGLLLQSNLSIMTLRSGILASSDERIAVVIFDQEN